MPCATYRENERNITHAARDAAMYRMMLQAKGESMANQSEAIFQCAWCQEANRADRDYNAKNGASIELTEYIFPIQMIGGYDKISNLPICENCADAAAEELAK